MASAIPFDTHSYVKKLQAAGVSEAQAEVQAQAQALVELASDQLATKSDLKELETKLLHEIELVRGEIGLVRGEIGSVRGEIGSVRGEIGLVRGDIELARKDTLIKLGGLIVAGITVLAALNGVAIALMAL